MIGLLASMVGGRGGSMLGRMVGGRTGAMLGGLAGSLIGGRKLGRLGRSLFNRDKGSGSASDDTADLAERSMALAQDSGEEDTISDDEAATLIRVMCNSAKADGHVDDVEARKITEGLGDEVSANERAFLDAELAAPMRAPADMASEVPRNLRSEAYAVSLLTVDVDTTDEDDYLQQFAVALGLSRSDVDEIHAELGVE